MLASLDDERRAGRRARHRRGLSAGQGASRSNKEKDIRQAFVEADLIEGVMLLPENLFYNTTAPGIILLLNKAKPAERRGPDPAGQRLQLLRQGEAQERPDRRKASQAVAEVYRKWETREKLSRVITLEEGAGGGLQPQPVAVRGSRRWRDRASYPQQCGQNLRGRERRGKLPMPTCDGFLRP